eukprot:UN03209
MNSTLYFRDVEFNNIGVFITDNQVSITFSEVEYKNSLLYFDQFRNFIIENSTFHDMKVYNEGRDNT